MIVFSSGISVRGDTSIESIEEEEMPIMDQSIPVDTSFATEQEILSKQFEQGFSANKEVSTCHFAGLLLSLPLSHTTHGTFPVVLLQCFFFLFQVKALESKVAELEKELQESVGMSTELLHRNEQLEGFIRSM